jgi:hypothetical protein
MGRAAGAFRRIAVRRSYHLPVEAGGPPYGVVEVVDLEPDQALVLVVSVPALAVEQRLVPAAAALDVGDTDERLRTRPAGYSAASRRRRVSV